MRRLQDLCRPPFLPPFRVHLQIRDYYISYFTHTYDYTILIHSSIFLWFLILRLTYRGISVGGDGEGVENTRIDFLDVSCCGALGTRVEGMLLHQLFSHHYGKVLLERDVVVLGDRDTPGKKKCFLLYSVSNVFCLYLCTPKIPQICTYE